MPLHVAPPLRALEEALEAEGLIKTIDSVAVTIAKSKEAAGEKAKTVPVATTRKIRGNSYTAS